MWCVLWGLGVVFIITGRRGHERRGRGDAGLKSPHHRVLYTRRFYLSRVFSEFNEDFLRFSEKAGQPSNARAWDHHANASASHNASGRTQSARRHKRTHTRYQHITALCGLVAHSGRCERSRSLPDERNQRKRAKKATPSGLCSGSVPGLLGWVPSGEGCQGSGAGVAPFTTFQTKGPPKPLIRGIRRANPESE